MRQLITAFGVALAVVALLAVPAHGVVRAAVYNLGLNIQQVASIFPYGGSPTALNLSIVGAMPAGDGECGEYSFHFYWLEMNDGREAVLVLSNGFGIFSLSDGSTAWALAFSDDSDQPWADTIEFSDSRFIGGGICQILEYAQKLLRGEVPRERVNPTTIQGPAGARVVKVHSFKEGVPQDTLAIPIKVALPNIDAAYRLLGYEAVITSTTEGDHCPDSHHYLGLAVDLRTRDVLPTLLGSLVGALKRNLGPDYDVVRYPTHIHVEFDKK